MDTLSPQKYILEEILGEGSLFICFSFLQRSHGWDLSEFQNELLRLWAKDIFDIHDENSEGSGLVSMEAINFQDTESLKSLGFLPKEKIWEEMNNP